MAAAAECLAAERSAVRAGEGAAAAAGLDEINGSMVLVPARTRPCQLGERREGGTQLERSGRAASWPDECQRHRQELHGAEVQA